ncbi:hypothetical protein SeMB42_g05520 [Synchytrium endobioticum]|uniref:CCDC113/CCDC96 coiled-coil domain-containing protein n=1 Tax=Synchytrium endobioticum TaxID=286115 RepID=A0A507CQZ9_9FUNG|nr:hypothetical protein SeMB42_g05520 [Synchytrium endobioticum]
MTATAQSANDTPASIRSSKASRASKGQQTKSKTTSQANLVPSKSAKSSSTALARSATGSASTSASTSTSAAKTPSSGKSRGNSSRLASAPSQTSSIGSIAPKSKVASRAASKTVLDEPPAAIAAIAVGGEADAEGKPDELVPTQVSDNVAVSDPEPMLRITHSLADLPALLSADDPPPLDDTSQDNQHTRTPLSQHLQSDILNSPIPTALPLPIDAVTFTNTDPNIDPDFDCMGFSLGASLYNRGELLDAIRDCLDRRETLRRTNIALQAKLAEYFRRRRAEDSRESEKSTTDYETRYAACLAAIAEMTDKRALHSAAHTKTVADLTARRDALILDSETRASEFTLYRRAVARDSENSRDGSSIPPKQIDAFEALAARKNIDVSAVQLEHIRLKNRLKRCEVALKQREELADGLHLIDFEQLKIENQAYNEKIEERNEELLKLRKKITTVVQVLTHVREKLQFVQTENRSLASQMCDIDALVSARRDVLPLLKRRREQLKQNGAELKNKHGLLGNHDLLRDHELKVDATEKISQKLQELKQRHDNLRFELQKVKRELAKHLILKQHQYSVPS